MAVIGASADVDQRPLPRQISEAMQFAKIQRERLPADPARMHAGCAQREILGRRRL